MATAAAASLPIGFTLAAFAETPAAIVVVIVLPVVAALFLWPNVANRRLRVVSWLSAAALVAASCVVAFAPASLTQDQFCNLPADPVAVCVRVLDPDVGWTDQIETGTSAVHIVKAKVLNSGDTKEIVIRIPETRGIEWVSPSLRYSSSKTDHSWQGTGDASLADSGISFGKFGDGAALYLNFAIRVADDPVLPCGLQTLVLPVTATWGEGQASGDLQVGITRRC